MQKLSADTRRGLEAEMLKFGFTKKELAAMNDEQVFEVAQDKLGPATVEDEFMPLDLDTYSADPSHFPEE